jgi:hypothetical protein
VLARGEMSLCHLPLSERRVFIQKIADGEVLKICQFVETQSGTEDVETVIKRISK